MHECRINCDREAAVCQTYNSLSPPLSRLIPPISFTALGPLGTLLVLVSCVAVTEQHTLSIWNNVNVLSYIPAHQIPRPVLTLLKARCQQACVPSGGFERECTHCAFSSLERPLPPSAKPGLQSLLSFLGSASVLGSSLSLLHPLVRIPVISLELPR